MICGGIATCSAYTVAPPPRAYFRMKELCAENGGRRVCLPPVDVQGFYEEGGKGCGKFCQFALYQGYEYAEASAPAKALSGYAERPGLYRSSKKPAGDPTCAAYYAHWGLMDPKHRPDHQVCIGAEPIQSLASRYRVVDRNRTEFTRNAMLVIKDRSIEEIPTGRRLAEARGYSLRWTGFFLAPF